MEVTASHDHVARVARMYHTNADAAAALGVTPRSFARICKRLGLETPHARARRSRQSARGSSDS